MGSFNSKKEKYDLKIHREVMCHDNEEKCKIWRGIDLQFQNWHEEFDEFWLEHLKVSKILMYSFWAKKECRRIILLALKMYRGIIFHKTEKGYKICRGMDLSFQNWHKKFYEFWPEHW